MLQTLNCIRMGEVLFDENLQLFIICSNCHSDLRNLQDFRYHLEKCEGLENLFHQGRQHFKYNTDKCSQLFGKTIKGIKEFLIYDYNDVEVTYTKQEENFIDLTNIEQELLDPKWYSDLNTDVTHTSPQKSSKQYDELVEAVTPFVQFKENFKSNNNGTNNTKSNIELKLNKKEAEKSFKHVKFDLNTNIARPTAKRKITTTTKILPTNFATPNTPAAINITTSLQNTEATSQISKVYCSKKQKPEPIISNCFVKPSEVKPIAKRTPTSINIFPPTTVPTNIIQSNPSQKTTTPTTITRAPAKAQTAQILNKLQNLGLQVKRTQPLPQYAVANHSVTNKTDTKTLEILHRLQSKGMKVKILNKHQTTDSKVNLSVGNLLQGPCVNTAQKPVNVIRNSTGNMAIKQNLNKNLIIKKVN